MTTKTCARCSRVFGREYVPRWAWHSTRHCSARCAREDAVEGRAREKARDRAERAAREAEERRRKAAARRARLRPVPERPAPLVSAFELAVQARRDAEVEAAMERLRRP